MKKLVKYSPPENLPATRQESTVLPVEMTQSLYKEIKRVNKDTIQRQEKIDFYFAVDQMGVTARTVHDAVRTICARLTGKQNTLESLLTEQVATLTTVSETASSIAAHFEALVGNCVQDTVHYVDKIKQHRSVATAMVDLCHQNAAERRFLEEAGSKVEIGSDPDFDVLCEMIGSEADALLLRSNIGLADKALSRYSVAAEKFYVVIDDCANFRHQLAQYAGLTGDAADVIQRSSKYVISMRRTGHLPGDVVGLAKHGSQLVHEAKRLALSSLLDSSVFTSLPSKSAPDFKARALPTHRTYSKATRALDEAARYLPANRKKLLR